MFGGLWLALEEDSNFCFCLVVVVIDVCLFTLRKRNIVSGLPRRIESWTVGRKSERDCGQRPLV